MGWCLASSLRAIVTGEAGAGHNSCMIKHSWLPSARIMAGFASVAGWQMGR
jgi:hypothetical protein